ncbi:MAG TPA: hypothetical protein PLP61_02620 [Nocardioides sp.]|uniref:hypothetical protein n=1 Tax=Nocardioides sp. TaxID=35761 RepID=UPI002C2F24A8|nr:hypothetical protein [Nocardioides sp.]HQR25910.1 hypothetical protein [Nocardioides sp.]
MVRGACARSRPSGSSGLAATVLAVTMIVPLVTSCSATEAGPDAPSAVPLRVSTVRGSGLDEGDRARLESEVGNVLARYLEAGFLGDYPRSDFVQSFADFTSGSAEQAVGDIDVLTAARYAEASSVRATDLEAALSFYVVSGEAVGATAWVHFAFDIDDRGPTATATLDGRLVLDRQDGRWSVFAYDVRRDDSDALPAEASS